MREIKNNILYKMRESGISRYEFAKQAVIVHGIERTVVASVLSTGYKPNKIRAQNKEFIFEILNTTESELMEIAERIKSV
ncbi:MAG: hypothetical protein ACRC0G_16950 [Fusobacteriaceae bacterium]